MQPENGTPQGFLLHVHKKETHVSFCDCEKLIGGLQGGSAHLREYTLQLPVRHSDTAVPDLSRAQAQNVKLITKFSITSSQMHPIVLSRLAQLY